MSRTQEQTARLIVEATWRIAEGDPAGIGAGILASLPGLSSGLLAMVHAKADDLRQFAALLAFSEAHNAPIFEADPSRRT